jgi:hypothetical protein
MTMTPDDAKLSAKAHALVQERERGYLLDRAKSLRSQAATKVRQAEQFERMAKALEAPAS